MKSAEERFFDKVMFEPNSGCWLWTACLNSNGYGRVGVYHVGTQLAHRVSWEFKHGPIPAGQCVLHKCDNPACVNPDHLFLGTQLDNLADMGRKQRRGGPKVGRKGEKSPTAKLTETQVAVIRTAKEPQRIIAAMFSISQRTVSDIRLGRRWKHSYVSA